MTCAVCGQPCDVVEHAMVEGVLGDPRKAPRLIAHYEAPLYHSIDLKTMEGEPFCGAICSTAWHGR